MKNNIFILNYQYVTYHIYMLTSVNQQNNIQQGVNFFLNTSIYDP